MGKIFGQSKEFWGGFSVGGIAGWKFLFIGDPTWADLAIWWVFKFFGTILLASATGLFTMLMADIYKHHIGPKWFPKKKKDEEENKFSDN